MGLYIALLLLEAEINHADLAGEGKIFACNLDHLAPEVKKWRHHHHNTL